MFTEQLTQLLSAQGVIMSTNHANGNDNTITAIDMSHFKRVIAIAELGVTNGGGNIMVAMQGSNTSGGTYTNISGSLLTLTGNNAGIGTLEIRSDQMPAGNRYLQVGLVVNSGPALCSVTAFGGEAPYRPASTNYDLVNTNGIASGGAVRTVT